MSARNEQFISVPPLFETEGILPEPRPADICSAVLLHDSPEPVPVEPRLLEGCWEPGVTMWEYIDGSGNVRANLTAVAPDMATPAWRIAPQAGDGHYYEEQVAVAGSGEIDLWYHEVTGIWVTGMRHISLPSRGERPVSIVPGDTFRLRAGAVGLHVLATFPGAPFEDKFEEQVPVPEIPVRPETEY